MIKNEYIIITLLGQSMAWTSSIITVGPMVLYIYLGGLVPGDRENLELMKVKPHKMFLI